MVFKDSSYLLNIHVKEQFLYLDLPAVVKNRFCFIKKYVGQLEAWLGIRVFPKSFHAGDVDI